MHRAEIGATLVEVAVVLGIIATTTAMIWRAEPLGSRLALRQAALHFISDMRTAQARSIGERSLERAYGLDLPVGGDRYTLFVRTGSVRRPLRTQPLPPGVRITYARFGGTNGPAIFFTGTSLFGAPSGGGTVTFTSGRTRLCVRIAPATARARVSNAGCP